jgi:hypothetical protein
MNNSSEFDDFMDSINEILDDLESINNSNIIKQKQCISYHPSGIPRHPNKPSFYEKKKPSSNILIGIAFLKKKLINKNI